MSTKPTLVDFYRSLMESVDIHDLAGDGLLTHVGDKKTKVTIGGRRLALPVREILTAAQFDSVIPFHPLCENVAYGRSVIIDNLNDYIEYRVNTLARHLASLAGSMGGATEIQKKIKKGNKFPFLKALAECDDKFLENLAAIISVRAKKPIFFSLVLTRNPRGGDSRVVRQCMVTSPLLDALDEYKATDGIMGVKIRKKDVPMFKGLFEYIVGDVTAYVGNSIVGSSPFFDALLTTYRAIADHLNTLHEDLTTLMGEGGIKPITGGLWQDMEDYARLRHEVPPLDDSMGIKPKTGNAPAPAAASTTPVAAPVVGNTPSAAPAPIAPPTGQYMTPSQRRRQQMAEQQAQTNTWMAGSVQFGPQAQQNTNPFAAALLGGHHTAQPPQCTSPYTTAPVRTIGGPI